MRNNRNETKAKLAAADLPKITVYWRPGCPFCMNLQRSIDKLDLPHEKINIWENPEGAATVRSIANGNEVVPTVVVGDQGMVNPSIKDLVDTALKQSQ